MNLANFFVVADTHFYKNSLGAYGKYYDKFMRFEQKCFAETQSINEALFEFLKKTDKTQNILFAGDLSFNGEKESNLRFIEMLTELKQAGKNIYVITAGHDYNKASFCFNEDGKHMVQGTKREELFDLYYDFGFKDAIAVDREHLSYVAQIADGVRLLALNNDGDCEFFQTYDDTQIKWIKEQIRQAKEDNQMIFAMNHYPLLPGQPIFSLVPTAVQKNADEITTMLADEGVHLVFTGHMHNQSINEKITASGNKFYDVCTGSAIACPAYIRYVEIEDASTVRIDSIPIPDFEWETNGRSCQKYLSDLFDSMILNMLDDMKNNPYRIMERFGMETKTALYPLVRFVGKKAQTITVGTVCRLFAVKCDASVKSMLFSDLVVKLVRSIFEGNQPYVEGTPEGDAFLGIIKKVNPLINMFNLKNAQGEKVQFYDLMKNTIGNYSIDDYKAVLKLQ